VFKICNIFKSLFVNLPKKRKSQFWFILFGMILMSITETFVLGCIAFFASLIADTNKVMTSSYVLFINDSLGLPFLSNSRNLIICVSIAVVCLVFIKNFSKALVSYWSIKFSTLIEGFFAGKLVSGFLEMPYEWHLYQNSADLILVSANWRTVIGRRFITSFLQALSDSLMISIMLTSLFIVQPLVSLIVISILGITSFVLFTSIRKKLDIIALQKSDYDQKINQQATKIIHGFKDVKISGKQSIFVDQYNMNLYEVSGIQAIQGLLTALPTLFLESMGFFMISFTICFMMFILDYSVAMVSGTITLLAVTAWRVLPAMNRILAQVTSLRSVIPYIDKILNYIMEIKTNETRNYKHQPQTDKKEIDLYRSINLNNISFSYRNTHKLALEDINFSINKGNIIGLIGASGAGKSTLVDIITGLLVPSHGKVLIDNQELNSYQIRSKWLTKLGYVPQTPYIFDGTIAENIAFEVTPGAINKEYILECCRMAAMSDFLDDLPNGIDSYIGERGVRLSGGQRQRISIARTLYQNPELIIFDEATSALDNENEKAILKTIYSLKGKQTMIIVAHRLSTIESCDTVVVLEQGKLKQMGPPQEILNQNN